MTYLQLINAVLRRLRETEVTAISETDYAKLVADFVNDAKRFVEDAHDWTALRTTITISATVGDYNYSLTGAQNRSKILDALNTTTKNRLAQDSIQNFNNYFLLASPASGSPDKFVIRGNDASGDPSVDIYPIPDGSYTLPFTMIVKQADLEDVSDVLTVPYQPVIHLAHAFAAEERGETGGTTAQKLFSLAELSLAQSIQMDSGQNPHELEWNVA